jgi:colanic acid/amylovoran biosynthesis glycosyltransferase
VIDTMVEEARAKSPSSLTAAWRDKLPAVLIFQSRLPGWSETFILEQARLLEAYRPIYVGLRPSGGLQLPAALSEVLTSGQSRWRFRELYYAATGRAPDFMKRLKHRRPALVHAHFGPSGALALPICQSLQIPLVVTFHGYDATVRDRHLLTTKGYSDKLYVFRRKKLLATASRIIAVSQFIADRLIARGVPREQIEVHYTGVDTDRFRPDSLANRERVVLFVGRLVEKKGCEFLIRAMQQVAARHPDATLVVIGDGALRQSLEKLSEQLSVRARFLGVQPAASVCRWMQRASVMCVPSVTSADGDSEGLGMVFLEAQACGVPVVATRHGPIPEVIEHGETGYLAPERNSTALAEHIGLLLTDRNTWHRISEAGRHSVCTRFDLATQTQRLERIYETITANTSRKTSPDG